MGYPATRFEAFAPINPAVLFAPGSIRRSYGRAAAEAAIENGMLPHELSELLAGRSVVDAFPVTGRESVAEYADRAVAEMMVAYLSQPLA